MCRVLAAVLFLASCGYQPDPDKIVPAPESADEATAMVVKAFAISGVPDIFWYQPDDRCAPGITDPYGGCDLGFRIGDVIVLSTQGGATLHDVSLAHELGHVAALEHDHDSDNACHAGRYFRDPGDVRDCKIPSDQRGLVGEANRMLAAAGM